MKAEPWPMPPGAIARRQAITLAPSGRATPSPPSSRLLAAGARYREGRNPGVVRLPTACRVRAASVDNQDRAVRGHCARAVTSWPRFGRCTSILRTSGPREKTKKPSGPSVVEALPAGRSAVHPSETGRCWPLAPIQRPAMAASVASARRRVCHPRRYCVGLLGARRHDVWLRRHDVWLRRHDVGVGRVSIGRHAVGAGGG
jgi:hypothetical protein